MFNFSLHSIEQLTRKNITQEIILLFIESSSKEKSIKEGITFY